MVGSIFQSLVPRRRDQKVSVCVCARGCTCVRVSNVVDVLSVKMYINL